MSIVIFIVLAFVYLWAGLIWARKVSKARPAQVNARQIVSVILISWMVAGLLLVSLRWVSNLLGHLLH